MTLTVHHLHISQSERIVWLCEELNIPYALKLYQRDATTNMAPTEFKALSPFGTAPLIEDDGLFLSESGAIVEYLISKYHAERLTRQIGHPEYPAYLFWLNFANSSFVTMGICSMLLKKGGVSEGTPTSNTVQHRLKIYLSEIEKRLGEAPYFAGDKFTAADIMMFFPLSTGRRFSPMDISGYPNIRAYLLRVGSRPAYIRAMSRGDPGFQPLLE